MEVERGEKKMEGRKREGGGEEEQQQHQQQDTSAEVAITNIGQWNQPTALPSVFLRPKKRHSVQVHQM